MKAISFIPMTYLLDLGRNLKLGTLWGKLEFQTILMMHLKNVF